MPWDIITGKIVNDSPLHLGSGKKMGNFRPTLKYIPGRALRGMIGNFLFHNDKELFKEIKIEADSPLETKILFKPGMPNNGVSIPLNLSICKKCKKIIKEKLCLECLNETVQTSGIALKENLQLQSILDKILLTTTISTHAPIERKTHSTTEHKLKPYNIESINRGYSFVFRIVCDSDYSLKVVEILNDAGEFYGLGGFRSKGFGIIQFKNVTTIPIKDWMAELPTGKWLVANSEIIFHKNSEKNFIGFVTEIILNYIKKSLEILGENSTLIKELKIEKQFFKSVVARGWTIKGKSRLDVLEPAIIAGSTAEIEITDKLQQILSTVGLGEKTHMGYGDIYFWGE